MIVKLCIEGDGKPKRYRLDVPPLPEATVAYVLSAMSDEGLDERLAKAARLLYPKPQRARDRSDATMILAEMRRRTGDLPRGIVFRLDGDTARRISDQPVSRAAAPPRCCC